MYIGTGLRFIVLGAATLCLWSTSSGHASAICKCAPSTVESSYNGKSDVFIASIDAEIALDGAHYYVGSVETTYKGCLVAGDLVMLKPPIAIPECGAQLSGVTHLINANFVEDLYGLPVLAIDACSYNVEASALTDRDLAFLDGRYVCCGDDCACADGSQPVNCFADPCQVAPACDVGECRSNYCGGCNAEFYTDGGYAVCQLGGPCASDEECGAAAWCREAARDDYEVEPSFECVPFAGEGASCDGYTLPSDYEICEPGLVCDTPDLIADASGICKRGCIDSTDCYDDEYCATDGVCALNGSCERHSDCNLGDNLYIRPRCLGYGVCDDAGQCGWRCGDPLCADLGGSDFGACDAVLGWAVQWGFCTPVSGCSCEVELFASEAECEASC